MAELTSYAVREWIKQVASGEFHYKGVLDGEVPRVLYPKLRRIIHDLVNEKEPVVEPTGRKDGYYRRIQDNVIPIDLFEADETKDFPVILPFDLRKYVWIDSGTAIVVAGSKSSGKSGFLYRTAALNMNHLNVVLLSNMEGGRAQMKRRFMAMDIEIPNPPPFKIYKVDDYFHDYIKEKDTLYLVDYIDAPEGTDFYLIGAQITKIRKKLTALNSVGVIGIQKPSNRDIGFGGETTLRDAALYLAMDSHKLKIVDAKVPADKKVYPKNMTFTYQYSGEGTNFLNIMRSEEL